MGKDNRRIGGWTVCALLLSLLVAPGLASAAEMGHGSMPGMKAGDHGKMGDKISSGTIARWEFEARLMDMKAHMEMAKTSGMKMEGMKMEGSHHLALHLSDPGTKTPVLVSKGKGTVTVTGPGNKTETSNLTLMQGHFGADVNLPKPGKYAFKTEIEAGGTKGSASFSYTVK